VRYDALLDQVAADMQLYMSCISDTIVITVPKAIVHCMVRQRLGVCVGGQARRNGFNKQWQRLGVCCAQAGRPSPPSS
jgi:hypothetical protein